MEPLINRQHTTRQQIFFKRMIGILMVFHFQLTFLCQLGRAARSRVPLNNVATHLEMLRNLEESCELVEEVEKEFCCDWENDKECDTKKEWFIDDEE